MQCEI